MTNQKFEPIIGCGGWTLRDISLPEQMQWIIANDFAYAGI